MIEFSLTEALTQIRRGICVRVRALPDEDVRTDDDVRKLKRGVNDDGIRPIKIRKIGINKEGPVYSLLSDESSEEEEVQVIEKTIRTIDLLSDDENSSSPVIPSPPTSKVEPSMKILKTKKSEMKCHLGENITTEDTETTATGENIVTRSVPTDQVPLKSIPPPIESMKNAVEASVEGENITTEAMETTATGENIVTHSVPTDKVPPKSIPPPNESIKNAVEGIATPSEMTQTSNVPHLNTPTEGSTIEENHDDDYRFIPVLPTNILRAIVSPRLDDDANNTRVLNELKSLGNAVSLIRLNPSNDRESAKCSSGSEMNSRVTETLSVQHRENDGKRNEITSTAVPSVQRMLPKDTRVTVTRVPNAFSSSELGDSVKVFNKEVQITRSVSDRPEEKKYDSSQKADNFSLTQMLNGGLTISALPTNEGASMPSLTTSSENPKPPSSSLPPKIRVKRFAQLADQNAMYSADHLLRDPVVIGNCFLEDHPVLRSAIEDVQPIRKEIDTLSLRLKVFFDAKMAQENDIRSCKRKNSNKPKDEVDYKCQKYEDSNRRCIVEELIPNLEVCVMSMEPFDFLSQLYKAFKARFVSKTAKQKQKNIPIQVISELLKHVIYSEEYRNINIRHKIPKQLFMKIMNVLASENKDASNNWEDLVAMNTPASSSHSSCKCAECSLTSISKSSVTTNTAVPSTSNLASSRAAISASSVFPNNLIDDAQIMPTNTLTPLSTPKTTIEHRPIVNPNSSHLEHMASHRPVPISTPTSPPPPYEGWNRNPDPLPSQPPRSAMPPMNRTIGGGNISVVNRVCEKPMPTLRAALARHMPTSMSPEMGNPMNSAIRQTSKFAPQPSAFPPNHGFSNERSNNYLSTINNRPAPPPYSYGISSAEEKAAFERRIAEITGESLQATQLQQQLNRSQALTQRYISLNSQGMQIIHRNNTPSQRYGTPVGQPLQKMNPGGLPSPRYAVRPDHSQHAAHPFYAQRKSMVPGQANYPATGYSNDMTFNHPQYNEMVNQMNIQASKVNQIMSRNSTSSADIQKNESTRRFFEQQKFNVQFDQPVNFVNRRTDNQPQFRSSPNMPSPMTSQQMDRNPVPRNYADQYGYDLMPLGMDDIGPFTEPGPIIRNSVQEQFIHSTGSPSDGPSPVPTTATCRTQDNTSPSGQIPVIESSSSPNNETNEPISVNTSDLLSKNVENLATEDLIDFENQLSEVIRNRKAY